ncbi:GtrA family protein [Trinickia sp. EG282A]|uniref:GtrA family protein n=1 Tax=Trinickia sp. EG282A TaxID=3237013 RepID=UPI0034D2090A
MPFSLPVLRKLTTLQFGKFLLSGGLAAGVNFISRFAFSRFLPFEAAVAAAFVCGMLTAFILMRTFVFANSTQRTEQQLSYFALVNLVGLGITVIVSDFARKLFQLAFPLTPQLNEAVGHLIGIIAPVLLSYYAHKRITFR